MSGNQGKRNRRYAQDVNHILTMGNGKRSSLQGAGEQSSVPFFMLSRLYASDTPIQLRFDNGVSDYLIFQDY